jgi:hypothetical protein
MRLAEFPLNPLPLTRKFFKEELSTKAFFVLVIIIENVIVSI